jgi:hypothetical protein
MNQQVHNNTSNAPNVKAATQDSMLLQLSGELRNMIHDFVFSDQVYEIRAAVAPVRTLSTFARAMIARERDEHPEDHEYLPLEGPASVTVPKNALSLLLTCRETYNETRLLPFRLPTFAGNKIFDINQFNLRTAASRIQLLASLEIRVPKGKGTIGRQLQGRQGTVSVNQDFEIDPTTADMFRSMTGLKRIHLHQFATSRPLREMLLLGEAIHSLQLLLPEAEVTGAFEALDLKGATKWIHSFESAQGMSLKERLAPVYETAEAVCTGSLE